MMNFLCIDRVAFTLFGQSIYWYGIIICLSIIVALVVATYYCKVKKYDTEIPINIAFVVVPIGILSARLFSCLFDDGISLADYFNFRTGGMSIIGAVIGGATALTAYVFIKKDKDKWLYFDTLVVVLILAQSIGRWGNFFNTEVYGKVIDSNSIFAVFPFAVKVNGVFYQALFLYESVLDLIGFLILSLIYLRSSKRGVPTAIYLIYYGTIRTILEPLRQEEYILKLGSLPISRLFSILMIIAGITIAVVLIVKSKKAKVLNEKK